MKDRSQYFPEPCKGSGENLKVELDLSNHAAETDMKETTGIDTHVFK